ncbi:hypothetical protein EJB05_15681, partial [Eragrostis curvula]
MCQVQILKLRNIWCVNFELDDLPLSSRHLTKLKLTGIGWPPAIFGTPGSSHKSLKRLSIINCDSSGEFRTLFYVPCLVSLRLDGHLYRAPVLESIPSLHEAFVRVVHENADGDCDDYSDYCEVEDCYSCHGVLDDNKCVLLEGLSEAENLTLISKSRTGPKHKVEMIGRYHPVDGTAAISEHLKAIKIKCEVVDEKVNKVLKFLRLT